MMITDGECPLCQDQMLRLNALDLLECPRCHLQIAVADSMTATVMPKRGDGDFYDGSTRIAEVSGLMLAKSKNGTVIPDLEGILQTRQEIEEYIGE